MRKDQRLATLLGWQVKTSEQAMQLLGQMALAYDPDGDPHLRRAALRRIVEARNLLDSASRERLQSAAGRSGLPSRLKRLLRPLETLDADKPIPRSGIGEETRPYKPLAQSHDDRASAGSSDISIACERSSHSSEGPRAELQSLGEMEARLQTLTAQIARFQADNLARLCRLPEDFRWASDENGFFTTGGDHFDTGGTNRLAEALVDASEATTTLPRQIPFRDVRARGRDRICRLNARPRFDDRTGRFSGYCGMATFRDRSAGLPIPESAVSELSHEILTPLNAIVGYAQMIEQQILGPAPDELRREAEAILRDAGQLLTVMDVLGEQAGRNAHAGAVDVGPVDGTKVIADLQPELEQFLGSRNAAIIFERSGHPLFLGDDSRFERHLRRLLLTLASMLEEGETLRVTSDDRAIRMALPQGVSPTSAQRLLGFAAPGSSVIDFELLGLSFSLRSMRETLEAGSGSLRISGREVGLYPYAVDRPEQAAVS